MKSVRFEECRIGRVFHWKGVGLKEGLEECKIGRVYDWKGAGLEECRIGRV